MKNNKYIYEVILQGNYAGTWEDLEVFATDSTYHLSKAQRDELKYLRSEYSLHKGCTIRTIRRKTKTEQAQ